MELSVSASEEVLGRPASTFPDRSVENVPAKTLHDYIQNKPLHEFRSLK
jgi:hypothetical protein